MSNSSISEDGNAPAIAASTAAQCTPGRGILAAGDRVLFVGRGDTFARRNLAYGEHYTVQSCGWEKNCVRLRLREKPGLAFLRSLFWAVP